MPFLTPSTKPPSSVLQMNFCVYVCLQSHSNSFDFCFNLLAWEGLLDPLHPLSHFRKNIFPWMESLLSMEDLGFTSQLNSTEFC